MEYIRLFIAVNLSKELVDKIKEIQKALIHSGEGIKWVPPENVHITLKFLGAIPIDKVLSIANAVKTISAKQKVFSINIKELGCFPGRKNPKIIWIGIREEKKNMVNLARQIDNEMGKLGFPKEERDFKAHLTIGRVKRLKDKQALNAAFDKFCNCDFGKMEVKYISLIQSQLGREGPKYTTLYKYMLNA